MAGSLDPFSPNQVRLIKESVENIRKIFKLQNETIPMMFRVGYSDPPTAKALKLKPEII